MGAELGHRLDFALVGERPFRRFDRFPDRLARHPEAACDLRIDSFEQNAPV